jgi:hypothetical protein
MGRGFSVQVAQVQLTSPGNAGEGGELHQRVADEARLLLDDHGVQATPEGVGAVIRRQIWMFGGEARMGPIDRMVLDALRRMAARADWTVAAQPAPALDRLTGLH